MAGFKISGKDNTEVLLAGGGSKALSDFAMSTALSGYLPLAGGTLNNDAVISRTGTSVVWINGRKNPIIKTTSYTGYNAILSMKTTNGSWDLGVYSNDTAYLTYITDTNYSASNNATTYLLVFQKKNGTIALTSDIPTKTSQLTNDSGFLTSHQSLANYLPLSGNKEITASFYLKSAGVSIIQKLENTSNYGAPIVWYKGGTSQATYNPLIGHHNTGDTNGSITILPYATETAPWGGTVGLYIGKNTLKWENKTLIHSGNISSYLASYLPLSGGTMTGAIKFNINSNISNGWDGATWSGLNILNSTVAGTGSPSQYATALNVGGLYWFLISFERQYNRLHWRAGNGESIWGWNTIIDSANISSYAITSHQSLANYVTLNGDQTITGAKTFNGTKFILAGNESNEILNIHYNNGLYYKYDDSAVLGGSISIRNALRFRWYNDYWVIGNIRSGNTSTYGFGIALLNSDGTHLLDRFMVDKNGLGYLNGLQIATLTWVNNSFAKIASHNNLMASGNEFTFASSEYSGTIWINYRTAGGTNGNITEYVLGNGKAGKLGTIIHTGNISSYALTSLRIADALGAGGAPITTSVSSTRITDSYYVLATTSSGSCAWYKLPSNAFLNDNTNTTYSPGTGLSLDGTTFNAKLATNTLLGVTKYVKYYSAASVKRYNGDVGGSEVDTSTTANIELAYASSTSGRFYPVLVDKNGFPFVNIPWSDTNTTYTFTTSGSGNVLTGVSTSGTTITFTKGNVSSGSTYGVVSNSENGLAPKVISTNTASIGSAYYVLASTNGSASPSWYKLPSTAFSDSNSWRPVLVDGASISSNTLNLKHGTNISLSRSNGDVTITASSQFLVVSSLPSGSSITSGVLYLVTT